LRRLEARSPVGIDLARDPPVEQVVGVFHPAQRIVAGVERSDAGQPVAVVPEGGTSDFFQPTAGKNASI
jgi:hypothetical protein